MIIENVAASFPSRIVCNEEVVDLIRFHSPRFEGDLKETTNAIKAYLDDSGLVTRHWQSAGERPIDHLTQAVARALAGTSVRPADIDLFIYVGVGRGFREPGTSYMVAKSLGILNAECFDVIDAGMSWTRAASLVDSLFKTDHYRNALVVNAEFNVTGGRSPSPIGFTLQSAAQLGHALFSYTIGEAATATLLRPDKPDNFRITFRSRPDLAGLFTIPSKTFKQFTGSSEQQEVLGIDRFTVKRLDTHREFALEISRLIEEAGSSIEDVDVVFTHTSSATEWHAAVAQHGLADRLYHLYPRTGNIVSASIPAALARSQEEGRLSNGDRVLFLMGSAGMSFAAGSFQHGGRNQ
jgi:3-oxoacyl-[acyl-carrier-protein] synthase III